MANQVSLIAFKECFAIKLTANKKSDNFESKDDGFGNISGLISAFSFVVRAKQFHIYCLLPDRMK